MEGSPGFVEDGHRVRAFFDKFLISLFYPYFIKNYWSAAFCCARLFWKKFIDVFWLKMYTHCSICRLYVYLVGWRLSVNRPWKFQLNGYWTNHCYCATTERSIVRNQTYVLIGCAMRKWVRILVVCPWAGHVMFPISCAMEKYTDTKTACDNQMCGEHISVNQTAWID